jgi:hypothetical protein
MRPIDWNLPADTFSFQNPAGRRTPSNWCGTGPYDYLQFQRQPHGYEQKLTAFINTAICGVCTTSLTTRWWTSVQSVAM